MTNGCPSVNNIRRVVQPLCTTVRASCVDGPIPLSLGVRSLPVRIGVQRRDCTTGVQRPDFPKRYDQRVIALVYGVVVVGVDQCCRCPLRYNCPSVISVLRLWFLDWYLFNNGKLVNNVRRAHGPRSVRRAYGPRSVRQGAVFDVRQGAVFGRKAGSSLVVRRAAVLGPSSP